MSSIHIYGCNHSPWCQAVLLTLHMKGLNYTSSTLLHPRTVLEGYRQGIPSPIRMPAMWYNGKCYYESSNIIELLDLKHPQKPELFHNISEQEVARNLRHISELFLYALSRVSGKKNLQFWYEWSIQQDRASSQTSKFLARFSCALTTLYFWCFINIARLVLGSWPEKQIQKPIAHFSEMMKKNGGKYLYGSNVTYLDILLLGHFQCMFSGSNGFGALSKEVIPIIDKHPLLWQWLKHMHQYHSLVDYPFMYSRCDQSVMERTGEREIGVVAREDFFGQITYWLGVLFFAVFWPFTLVFLLVMLGTRFWMNIGKPNGHFADSDFKFKFKKQI